MMTHGSSSPPPKRRHRIGRIDAPSPNRVAAAELVRQLSQCRKAIDEIERRGGIVAVLDQAQLAKLDQGKLVADLALITVKVRSYISAIGDDRRQRVALPIPRFPSSETPAEHPHDAAGDSPISQPDGVPNDGRGHASET
jgi:hypothetical protein